MSLERTLILIKPDAAEQKLSNAILDRLINETGSRFLISDTTGRVSEKRAREHYHDVAQRHGETILERLVRAMTSGPVTALILEGENVINRAREIIGPTEPASAPPGTIRGDYSMDSYEAAAADNRAIKNLVHASDSPENAVREIKLWFPHVSPLPPSE
jgi:nucleoside-diphosphate kinase